MKTKKPTKRQLRRAEVQPKREFPAHLNTTPDEWRALKRGEWREVRQALNRYYHGSAFTPAHSALYKLGQLVAEIEEALDAPDWIAW